MHTHTLQNGVFLTWITSELMVVSGAEVNATVIGENDPVDEVQGFLFGKLKWVTFLSARDKYSRPILPPYNCIKLKLPGITFSSFPPLPNFLLLCTDLYHFSPINHPENLSVCASVCPPLSCSHTRTIYPELKEQLKELRKHLVESTNEMAPLKVWQMQGVSSSNSLSHLLLFFFFRSQSLGTKWVIQAFARYSCHKSLFMPVCIT